MKLGIGNLECHLELIYRHIINSCQLSPILQILLQFSKGMLISEDRHLMIFSLGTVKSTELHRVNILNYAWQNKLPNHYQYYS